ncbi:MAG: hypothetical protein ACTSYB_03840 [Candidatus Helarchaeota archaeon]
MNFWISFGLELLIILVCIYLFLPIIWKLWAVKVNAAYKPSKLDIIAQPTSPQNNIPEVIINESGLYEIKFGNGRIFYNGTFQIHYKNQWYAAHAEDKKKKLKLLAIQQSSNIDVFGSFEKTSITWELEDTSIQLRTNIYIYPNQPIIKFQVEFPKGIKNVTTKKFGIPIFKFPYFKLEGPNQRILAFQDSMFSPPTRKIPKKGTQGPILFYDNDLNSVVIGPLDHFMIAYTGQDEMIYHGLEGKVREIPEGYEHSVLLFFSKGINETLVNWCGFLHKYHKTSPKNPYDDYIVANLGFWTDNGAYYYYRKEKGMTYEQTVVLACNLFHQRAIPFKYFQLDSWWYQKDMKAIWKYPPFSWLGRLIGGGAYGGTLLWEAVPEEFPNGLKALHKRIGLPFACHSRWISPKSPYIQKYKSVIAKSAALPMEPRFWDDLMRKAAEQGIIMYEQDWLNNIFTRIPFLQENVYAAENWLTWMAEAAHKNNISIQYCMAPSGAFLYALKLPSITNARVTGDYHARATKQFFYPQFSQTNILVWGVGIWPSLDCYLTTKTPLWKGLYREKYPEQMTLLSNLGGGVICPGDKAERVNKNLLMKTCTEEGLLLKPDRPITANDLMFKIHQKPYIMDTWTQKGNLFWRYIVVVNLWHLRVKDSKVTLEELGYREKGVLYDFMSGEIREITPTTPIDIKLKRMGCKYLIFAPFLKEGIALIGSPDKYVTCANKLIPMVQMDASILKISVEYSPNSTLRVLIYSRIAPKDVKTENDSISLRWDYEHATRKLKIVLTFSENKSTDISVIFNE